MNGKIEWIAGRIVRGARRVWSVVWAALNNYVETDGEQRAASFAYYAFFSLFPLIVLLISAGSIFVDKEATSNAVISFIRPYITLRESEVDAIINTINGVVESRHGAGVLAFLVLAWSSLRFFQALVRGVNRAWHTKEYAWWHLPLKNLGMVVIVASALLLGIVAPAIVDAVEAFWRRQPFAGEFGIVLPTLGLMRRLVPWLVLFYGFTMFYKFAPRQWKTFSQVWPGALTVTILLQLLQWLFVLYTRNIANFNVFYGAFGSVIALLMWIYLSGSVIIFGGCLCAAQTETRGTGETRET